MNGADKMIKTLCARGIVSASDDNGKCKRKIVELGLTIPEGKNDCLLYGVERQDAMYIFVCFRDPRRSSADRGFVGLKFDFAKYRGNPLAPAPTPSSAKSNRNCQSDTHGPGGVKFSQLLIGSNKAIRNLIWHPKPARAVNFSAKPSACFPHIFALC